MPLLNPKVVASVSLLTACSLFLWIIPCGVLAIMAILAGITFVFGVILFAVDAVLISVVFLLVAYARELLFFPSLEKPRELVALRSLGGFSRGTRNVLMLFVGIVGGLALLNGLQLLLVQGIYPLTPLIYPLIKLAWFQVAALCAVLLDVFERSRKVFQT